MRLLVLCCGCSSLLITVEAPRNLNGERPVRMLVRAVERGEFVSDSYQQVSDKVVSKDDSVLLCKPIYPNSIYSAEVPKAQKNVAVYFFFTDAGGEWKALLETPLPYSARIVLGANTIRRVERLH